MFGIQEANWGTWRSFICLLVDIVQEFLLHYPQAVVGQILQERNGKGKSAGKHEIRPLWQIRGRNAQILTISNRFL